MSILSNLLKKYSYADLVYDGKVNKILRRWVVMLPGAGCTWAKTSQGGCYMCGFKDTTRKFALNLVLPCFILLRLFKEAYKNVKSDNPEYLSMFNGGSYLNNKEISINAQVDIMKQADRIDSLESILIESRPEYIVKDKIELLSHCLHNKRLIVGIGLECQSDIIRNNNINKGFSRAHYEQAVKTLKSCGAEVLTYLFIKPINLSEKKALDEAIASAKYSFNVGTDYVVFNAALIQKGTIMEKQYKEGKYRPPWLWTIIEILKSTKDLGPVRIGDFTDEPKPIAGPYNCDRCTDKIKESFNEYKISNDINIFNKINCSCKDEWQKQLNNSIK